MFPKQSFVTKTLLVLLVLFTSFFLNPVKSTHRTNVSQELEGTGVHSHSLSFLVMGDWGGLPDFPYKTPIERAVAQRMGKVASQINSSFTLALGDNFYFDGVKDVDDPRFKETYESIFTSKYLQTPWYLIAGNHDHNGNVTAQIEYSKRDHRWKYPNLYYKLSKKLSGSHTVDILMLDTVILCGNSDDDRLGLLPGGPESTQDAEKQWQWIETQLRASKADYIIVAGHYPVFSVAEHGPTPELVKRLLPMLHKYNVTAYFSGHEHNLQHLEYTTLGHTVQYFISGAANFVEYSKKHAAVVPKGSNKFYWGNIFSLGAFSYVTTNKRQMEFVFVEANGKVLYRKAMSPRK